MPKQKRNSNFIIATADCETDPFEYGKKIAPFVWGFYSEAEGANHFWDEKKCTEQFIEFLYQLEDPHIIYMHNGGKFDFMFLLEYIVGAARIVNGRIIEARIGPHIIRDSYAAIPIALSVYKKDDMDYNLLKKGIRNKHKTKIINYLNSDCKYLHEMISRFIEEFGQRLTIGGAAMEQLQMHHEFEIANKEFDNKFRPFYSGGRNQCFKTGIVQGDIKLVDINSSYPASMLNDMHPIGLDYTQSTTIDLNTDFATIEAINYGALAMRVKNGLDFTAREGIFNATGHEIRAGLETGTLVIKRVIEAYQFIRRSTFADFINHFYNLRIEASIAEDDLLIIFYKLILNSAYGKFCTDCDDFKDWFITAADEMLDWPWVSEITHNEYILWSKPSLQKKYYNVATGSSITGASRARLLYGLAATTNPIYCDTDSIFYIGEFKGEIDKNKLGAWKPEANGQQLAIAGKKMYALLDQFGKVITTPKGKEIKASKGVRLTAEEIIAVAKGDVVKYENPVPLFKLDGNQLFGHRNIQITSRNIIPFGQK